MNVSVEPTSDGQAVVKLNGRLDLLSAADVKTKIAETVAGGSKRLIVDLAEVSFIDSSGLGALIGGLKSARLAGGDLRLARPTEQAKLILQLTTLDRVMRPYATLEEAAAGF